MKRTSLCLFVAVCICFVPVANAEFQAGAALRLITPDPLLPISGGVGTPEPVTGKKGDLFARALVLQQGDTRVAIVGVDNIGLPKTLVDKARANIKGIPADHVLIGATHTHSAPEAYGFPDGKGGHTADLAYLEQLVTGIADAVNEAVENLQAADIKLATGEIADRISWNAYAEALFDPRCNVLQAVAKDGKIIATMVNYAVHPEVLGPRRATLSPDLCGPFYDRIEASGGGMALFMNSAQGGMVTADNRIPGEDGEEVSTWEECVRIGELLADESLRLLSDAKLVVDPPLYVAAKPLKFPVDSEMMRMLVEGSPLMELNPDASVVTTLNLINLGPAQMITIPGEALPNIGAYLKRKMPTDHAFLLGLTNDAFGYILTKEDFGAFKRYDYISRTSLGERTGEILVNEVLALIEASPKPAGR